MGGSPRMTIVIGKMQAAAEAKHPVRNWTKRLFECSDFFPVTIPVIAVAITAAGSPIVPARIKSFGAEEFSSSPFSNIQSQKTPGQTTPSAMVKNKRTSLEVSFFNSSMMLMSERLLGAYTYSNFSAHVSPFPFAEILLAKTVCRIFIRGGFCDERGSDFSCFV